MCMNKFFIPALIVGFIMPAACHASTAQRKLPIPPSCIYAMVMNPGPHEPGGKFQNVGNVKIASCKNKKIPKLKKPNFFKYTYLGYAAPYYYFSTTIETDGQMAFSGIAGFNIKDGEIQAHDVFFGDYCNNGLVDAKVDETGITMGVNFTSWDVINYMHIADPDKDTYYQPKIDILQSPALCDGVMHWHVAKGTEQFTPLSFTFKPNYDFKDPHNPKNPEGIHYDRHDYGKAQDCYFKIAQPYAKKYKTLNMLQLHDLQETFSKQCNLPLYGVPGWGQ